MSTFNYFVLFNYDILVKVFFFYLYILLMYRLFCFIFLPNKSNPHCLPIPQAIPEGQL